jgi:hypothetical protein
MVYRLMDLLDAEDWIATVLGVVEASLLYSLVSFGLVCGLKWLLVGRYKPRQAPMWTLFVWLSEAVTVAYESLAVPALLDHLKGTPFLPWALRCMGAKIGKGVWLNTTDLTEFDCVEIGDHAELNAYSGPEGHGFTFGPFALRFSFDAAMSQRAWREFFVPAFRATARAGARAFMCSYTAVTTDDGFLDNTPACASAQLLTRVLRA